MSQSKEELQKALEAFNDGLALLNITREVFQTMDKTARRAAYRKAALKCHPDKNLGNEAAARANFNILSDLIDAYDDPAIPLPLGPNGETASRKRPFVLATEPELSDLIKQKKWDDFFRLEKSQKLIDFDVVKKIAMETLDPDELYIFTKSMISHFSQHLDHAQADEFIPFIASLVEMMNERDSTRKKFYDVLSDVEVLSLQIKQMKNPLLNDIWYFFSRDKKIPTSLDKMKAALDRIDLHSEERDKDMVEIYKSIHHAMTLNTGAVSTLASYLATVGATAKGLLFPAQEPTVTKLPWEGKSDQAFYQSMIGSFYDPANKLTLQERKIAALTLGFGSGYIDKNLLLTMIYIDRCPVENYLGITPDHQIESDDGGYDAVNSYISFQVIRFPLYGSFHADGKLDFKDKLFHTNFYGQLQCRDVLLDSAFECQAGSLPSLIKERLIPLDDAMLSERHAQSMSVDSIVVRSH